MFSTPLFGAQTVPWTCSSSQTRPLYGRGALGLCVGSFLNVVIYRLPKMMEAAVARRVRRARGRGAHGPPRIFNLVHAAFALPVVRGADHRAAERAGGELDGARAASAPTARRPSASAIPRSSWRPAPSRSPWRGASAPRPPSCRALAFVWALLALTFIDLDTQLLPDDITLPLLWLGLLVNSFGVFTDLHSAVLGAVAGYMVLWLVYWGFRLIAGKEGMGYGDFKLLAALGAWAGWQVLPFVIVVSAGVGAVVGGLVLWLSRSGMRGPHSVRALPRARRYRGTALGQARGGLVAHGKRPEGDGRRAHGRHRLGQVHGGGPAGRARRERGRHRRDLARASPAPGGAAMAELGRVFGAKYVAPDGSLRPRRHARARLRGCRRRARGSNRSCTRRSVPNPTGSSRPPRGPYAVLVVPLLFETRRRPPAVARTLVVDCPEEVQVRAHHARSGLAEAQVRAIMATQWPRWRRLAARRRRDRERGRARGTRRAM